MAAPGGEIAGPGAGPGPERAEYEAEHPQFSDVPESEQVPESQQGSVPLEAGILQPSQVEQVASGPAAHTVDQELFPVLEAAPSSEPPDPKTCSPREYIEYYIFPVLLPGLAELLHEAEKENCFEGGRTKFIASDFLTEWLYNKNPKTEDESFTEFFSIPFVEDWLKDHVLVSAAFTVDFIVSSQMANRGNFARMMNFAVTVIARVHTRYKYSRTITITVKLKTKVLFHIKINVGQNPADMMMRPIYLSTRTKNGAVSAALDKSPRPPIPLSLLLSEEEASIIIQSFWRGYRVRCDSEIQELRQWQRKLREERHIKKIVKEFWTKQEAKVGSTMEDLEEHTQNHSTSLF